MPSASCAPTCATHTAKRVDTPHPGKPRPRGDDDGLRREEVNVEIRKAARCGGRNAPLFVNAEELRSLVDDDEAREALRAALRWPGFDVESDPTREAVDVPGGEILLMPSSHAGMAGVKLVTVAHTASHAGLPRIQGLYVAFDDALTPIAVIDGAELTLIRTPAVSSLAVAEILRGGTREPHVDHLVLMGTGRQAERHAWALASFLTIERISVIGRRVNAAAALCDRLTPLGVPVRPAGVDALRSADLIVCATSSPVPVFEDSDIRLDAVVVAIGAHGLSHREVPAAFARRAQVVVEGIESALRESGDLIPARSVEEWRRTGLTTLGDLVNDRYAPEPRRPVLFTGVGMAWEDVAIARRALVSAGALPSP